VTGDVLVVRTATPHDEALLGQFSCSGGPSYETEVEQFVRKDLLSWGLDAAAAEDDPRVLLLLDPAASDQLVAVAAHERLTELKVGDRLAEGTKAQVIAVSLEARGTTIAGRRPGDLAFSALVNDARVRDNPRGPLIAAVVSTANRPSLAMCDRNGLNLVVDRSPGYVWRIGRL
jgi:hypothetical protein